MTSPIPQNNREDRRIMGLSINRIFAIDPGPETSAWVLYDDARKQVFDACACEGNDAIISGMLSGVYPGNGTRVCVIEEIVFYGRPVGRAIFETCTWIGRFEQCLLMMEHEVRLISQPQVRLHLCGNLRAGDCDIRQAIIDRFGSNRKAAIGTKKDPGPLYGIKSHAWSALALAIVVADWERGVK